MELANSHDVATYPTPMLRLIDGDLPETGGDEEIPLPLTTMVHRAPDGQTPMFDVHRTWHATDARRCELCPLCHAIFFRSGYASCSVPSIGVITDAEAPLYRQPQVTSSVAS